MSNTIRGGFVTDAATLEAVFGPGAEAAAQHGGIGVSAASPVLTGALSVSWVAPDALQPTVWTGPSTLVALVTSPLPYAAAQEYASRNAGYAERGLAEAAPAAVDAASSAIAPHIGRLWGNA